MVLEWPVSAESTDPDKKRVLNLSTMCKHTERMDVDGFRQILSGQRHVRIAWCLHLVWLTICLLLLLKTGKSPCWSVAHGMHFPMPMYGKAWLLSLLDRMFALLGPCRVLRAVKPPVFFPHLSKHPCMWRHSASPSFLGARFWERKAGVKAGSYCRKGKTLE